MGHIQRWCERIQSEMVQYFTQMLISNIGTPNKK